MSIIYVLIPIAILFVCIGLGIFFWAVRSKQFDDLDKEAFSILFDNENKATKPQQQPENLPVSDTMSPDDKSPLNAKKEL